MGWVGQYADIVAGREGQYRVRIMDNTKAADCAYPGVEVLPDGTFIFGSELKSLLAHGGLSRELEPRAVEEYFALGYVPEPRTIFSGAAKLPPAHTLTVQHGMPVPAPKEYWDVNFTLDAKISAEAA